MSEIPTGIGVPTKGKFLRIARTHYTSLITHCNRSGLKTIINLLKSKVCYEV